MTHKAKSARAIWSHSNAQPYPSKFFANRTRGLQTGGAQQLKVTRIKVASEGAETQKCCLPFWSWRALLFTGLRLSPTLDLCTAVLPIQLLTAWSFPPKLLTNQVQALPFWISSLKFPASISSNQSCSLTSILSSFYPYLSTLYVIFLLLFLASYWKLPVPIRSEFIPTFILGRAVIFLAKSSDKISLNQILSIGQVSQVFEYSTSTTVNHTESMFEVSAEFQYTVNNPLNQREIPERIK